MAGSLVRRSVPSPSQRRIEELERSLKYAEQAASCAPKWFREFKAFEVAKCSRGQHEGWEQ